MVRLPKKTSQCKAYGCQWQRQPAESAQLPMGYMVEKCAWCKQERTVLERGF